MILPWLISIHLLVVSVIQQAVCRQRSITTRINNGYYSAVYPSGYTPSISYPVANNAQIIASNEWKLPLIKQNTVTSFVCTELRNCVYPKQPKLSRGIKKKRFPVDITIPRDSEYPHDVSCKLAVVDTLVDVGEFVRKAIHPNIVSDEYYRYAHWRMLERFTLAAAMALASQIKPAEDNTGTMDSEVAVTDKGISHWLTWATSGKVSSALTTIVLKDIFSRILNFVWFGQIGAGFDDNPKAFRLLGGLLCSAAGVACFIGNMMQLEPKVVLTVLVNVIKHVGAVTMVASQATFHSTFCVKNAATNVGEITAKLETQSPICDFLGMAAGTSLGALTANMAASMQTVLFTGMCLTSNIATYMCAKSVCFRTLNPQRCFVLLENFASVLLRRLDSYLKYHKMRLQSLSQRSRYDIAVDSSDGTDSAEESQSDLSCFDDDECGTIAEMIYNYEFDTANRILNRFTSVHLCKKLKRGRKPGPHGVETNERYPNEPLNLVQKGIGIMFLTPEQVAARETLLFPWRDGYLKHGAVKYSLADMSVSPAALTEYLKVFKGERFVVALGSEDAVECTIHRSATPRDAMLAILTYNIADKLWTILAETMEQSFFEEQLEQIWDMCKRSAVSLKEVLAQLKPNPNTRKRTYTNQDADTHQNKVLSRWGLQTVTYAYNVAKACIDEVMLSAQAAKWDIDKFELCSPFKN